MRIIGYILLIIVVLFGITFTALNYETVTINYYVGENRLPLSLLLVLAFILGCLIGIFVMLWAVIKTKVSNYRLQRRLDLAEKEIENLRAIPLQDKV